MNKIWALLGASAVLVVGGCGTNDAPPSATTVVTVTAGEESATTEPTITVTETAATSTTPAAGATEVIDLVAVGKDGQPRAGWTVDGSAGGGEVQCEYWTPSRSAVTPGLYECSPSAAGAHTCWPSAATPTGLLCGIDPWKKTLLRYTSNVALKPIAAPTDPQPWGLELADGTKCLLRHGGAWGGREDGYLGAYSCDKQNYYVLAKDSNAVDTSSKAWTVKVGDLGAGNEAFPPPSTVGVVRAYFAAAEQ